MALAVEQQVAWLQVTMEKVGGVHELQALEHLIDDVLLVDVFEDVRADHSMQICIHEIEHQVDITIVLGPDHVLQADNVLVTRQLLQENDLSEGTLRVCCVLESVEVFLQCNDLFSLLVNGFPHDTVGALTYTQ